MHNPEIGIAPLFKRLFPGRLATDNEPRLPRPSEAGKSDMQGAITFMAHPHIVIKTGMTMRGVHREFAPFARASPIQYNRLFKANMKVSTQNLA
jgi:hypothetical protein